MVTFVTEAEGRVSGVTITLVASLVVWGFVVGETRFWVAVGVVVAFVVVGVGAVLYCYHK